MNESLVDEAMRLYERQGKSAIECNHLDTVIQTWWAETRHTQFDLRWAGIHKIHGAMVATNGELAEEFTLLHNILTMRIET